MSDTAEVELTSYELVERLQAVHTQIAAAQAEEVALMTRLYRLRRAQQLEAGVAARYAGESAATEIGVAVRVSQRTADGLIALGMGLTRLPRTQRAFAEGRIDLARARAIHDTLVNAPDETVTELEDLVVARAERCDPARLRQTIRKKLLEIDPAGQTRRRQEAERERYVAVRAADDGTALLDGVLPAAGGWSMFERLREMAITQCCAADPRTMNQRRADALVALADGSGQLTCGCDLSDCPRRDPNAPVPNARRALVQVGVSAATLLGVQDNPGLLAGFGAIDADLARQIARHARFQAITETPGPASELDTPQRSAGPFTTTSENTDTNCSPPHSANPRELRYRPSERLAARVRALDGICRAPGCQTPAAATDLDHQLPFDHRSPTSGGRTTEQNLGCRCRRHHRLKTLADHGMNGWTVTHHRDRRIEWRTPTGGVITTRPEGAKFLFPHTPVPTTQVKPIDPQPDPPLLDPGPVINALTELLHVYIPPSRRNRRVRDASQPVRVATVSCGIGRSGGDTDPPPF
ncbi:HNH endonuclease signature motif containing protein [Nocardia otitidiscaviarum]|uniref:HNH endonuclease signature motif containing protein n=1 Tax=Nocardia otitidiscaviarum TaxID=1823 RepID=UPI001895D9C8|nr:HNH endonuclease signature motif containing protein [Nocardia otitidiscaviarum]MBF6182701.1 DUF222 domain-containing protein [Nocardia otitidiscaviarum]